MTWSIFKRRRTPSDQCAWCKGTGRGVGPGPVQVTGSAAPKQPECYVQGCRETPTWHDVVELTFPSSEDTRRVVKLGLNTCDLHCWEIDQAIGAGKVRVKLATARRRPYKTRSTT